MECTCTQSSLPSSPIHLPSLFLLLLNVLVIVIERGKEDSCDLDKHSLHLKEECFAAIVIVECVMCHTRKGGLVDISRICGVEKEGGYFGTR